MLLNEYLEKIQEAGTASFSMYQKYGTVALLTVNASTVYNYIYRQTKTQCTKGCKSFQTEPICWYKCYIRAVSIIRAAIARDLGRAGTIPSTRQRNQLKKEIQMQLERFEAKEEKLRERLARLT